jgi:hypothetical protein
VIRRFGKSCLISSSCIVLGLSIITGCAQKELTVEDSFSPALVDEVGESFYFHGQFQNQVKEGFFIVEEDDDKDWGNVIVLNRSGRSFQVPSDTETPLWIYGTVETVTPEILREYQVDESNWSTYEGQSFIAAEKITLVPSPQDLASNPRAFLNQEITVYGKVDPIESATNTFILQEPNLFGGKGVILIQGADADLSALVGLERAVVSGILRPYVIGELKDGYGLTWSLDLQQKLEADFEQEPVIVVQQALPAS